MIIDLKRFTEAERPYWTELEDILARLDADPGYKLPLNQIQRFHYLYERTSGGLARLMTILSNWLLSFTSFLIIVMVARGIR